MVIAVARIAKDAFCLDEVLSRGGIFARNCFQFPSILFSKQVNISNIILKW